MLDLWAEHAADLRVLILASRGPADPLAPLDAADVGAGQDRDGRAAGRSRGPGQRSPCCPTASRTTRTTA